MHGQNMQILMALRCDAKLYGVSGENDMQKRQGITCRKNGVHAYERVHAGIQRQKDGKTNIEQL